MSKQRVIWVIALVLCCCFGSSHASQPDSILFRGIPWYTSEAEVVAALSGVVSPGEWDTVAIVREWVGVYGIESYGGGVRHNAKNVPVAGYDAVLSTYFMYDISQGFVNEEIGDSQFYLAIYDIHKPPFAEEAFANLVEKLTVLYGQPLTENEVSAVSSELPSKTHLWMSKENDLVWLHQITYNNGHHIFINYIAPNANERLLSLKEQMLQDEKKAEMERVANNFEGLQVVLAALVSDDDQRNVAPELPH